MLSIAALSLSACQIDNYDEPEAEIEGVVIDKITGEKMQLSQGTGNLAIRIVETSYTHGDSTIVVTPQTLNVMQDGTFLNTRLFEGLYDMYPWESCCYEGEKTKQIVNLKSGKRTKVTFEVTPYFEVKWAKEPWQDEEGYVHASLTFTANPTPDDTYTPAVPQKAQFFISRTEKVGTSSDSRYTNNEVNVSASDEGKVIELVTKKPIDYSQKFWFRLGVKAKADGAHGVYDKYCLSEIKALDCKGVNSSMSN